MKSEKRFTTTQSKSMLYISHTWGHNYNAYQVRINNILSAIFNWNLYGSERKALLAAKKFRDSLLSHLKLIQRFYKGNLKGRRNKTGIVGVSKTTNSKTGIKYYAAQWRSPDGKHIQRAFSVNKYGEERAKQLAIEIREQNIGSYPTEALEEMLKLKDKLKETQKELYQEQGTAKKLLKQQA